jgi:hypothetical protein
MGELGPTGGYEWHRGMYVPPTDRQAPKHMRGPWRVLNEPGGVLEGGGALRRYLWQWKEYIVGAWIGSMHHPLLWLPSQIPYKNSIILAFFFEILVFFSKFFVPQAQVELFILTVGIFIL